ncbi:uncharacterized protein LAESUDRAFT_249763 [Laetiporus sulphureus 93-53]|uniref:Uncharacterized protein n=1 Tax=Laetiporus sulphureus 93-53 TaxID=1314785 RepID=A0A165DIW0_9APHY|nr:uncharacterized protein LAESUDRAFT_249763 [Laetiporus sulphureus 93-53]KZT04980.1 hypothetical protein LAESUDRAFT_249763 [Laetiporus sulphureus 93-53]
MSAIVGCCFRLTLGTAIGPFSPKQRDLAAPLSSTHDTSLRRLWLTNVDIREHSDLNTLCRCLLSIKSRQLQEIVILFNDRDSCPSMNVLHSRHFYLADQFQHLGLRTSLIPTKR